MARSRRGAVALLAGIGVMTVRGADEAATLIARGVDDLIYGGSKSSDEAASKTDDLASAATRYYRQKRIESLLRDETATESFTLPENYYAGFAISPGYRARLSYAYETEWDVPIDVFLFDTERFDAYRNDGGVSVLTSGVSVGTSADSGTLSLERDTEYVLVFDHTEVGVADTVDTSIDVDTQVSLAVR